MVISQQLASIELTLLSDVAELVSKRVLMRKMVYFVTDQYEPGSIRYLAFEKRKTSDSMMRVRIERREQKRQKQWKNYLRNDQNKSELVNSCYRIAHIRRAMLTYFFLQLFCFSTVAHNILD